MVSDGVGIKHKLEECVHLDRVLRQDQLSVVLDGQLFQAEEAKVCEHHIQDQVVSVSTHWVALEENFGEDLQEILITDASVKDLLNKYFLVWILHVAQKVVSVGIDCVDHRVECLHAFNASFNEFGEFHLMFFKLVIMAVPICF